MKTFVMAAVAATVTAGAALAHPVNEPHICGIDPSTVMDWPASNWVSENTGQIYDKGAYFFIATNDNDGSGEYTTTHTRIWKDSMEHNGVCRVTGIDIFHADDEPMMEEEESAEDDSMEDDSNEESPAVDDSNDDDDFEDEELEL